MFVVAQFIGSSPEVDCKGSVGLLDEEFLISIHKSHVGGVGRVDFRRDEAEIVNSDLLGFE